MTNCICPNLKPSREQTLSLRILRRPSLFKERLHSKTFPDVFRQRWNLIYQFFHEGNPSTQLNRTIADAKKLFLKVNVQFAMMNAEMLEQFAIDNWAEYFIGVSDDQQEVLRAKNRFAMLDPPNASAFWGILQN